MKHEFQSTNLGDAVPTNNFFKRDAKEVQRQEKQNAIDQQLRDRILKENSTPHGVDRPAPQIRPARNGSVIDGDYQALVQRGVAHRLAELKQQGVPVEQIEPTYPDPEGELDEGYKYLQRHNSKLCA